MREAESAVPTDDALILRSATVPSKFARRYKSLGGTLSVEEGEIARARRIRERSANSSGVRRFVRRNFGRTVSDLEQHRDTRQHDKNNEHEDSDPDAKAHGMF